MKPDEYQRACELFDEVWATPMEERAARLAALCGTDDELLKRVGSMLSHAGTAERDGFLAGTAASARSCSMLRPTTLLPGSGKSPIPEPRFRSGAIIAGRYRIALRLGIGGMGEVYRAEDLVLGQTVALRFLSHAHVADSLRLAALLGEVRLGREVAHANVCRVYEVWEADGERFISMEFIEGEDLASQLRRVGPPHRQTALRVAKEICLGLAALHSRGLVHRDLKPGNIMLDREGHVRIVDFGLAVAAGTNTSQVAGTLGYIAPECVRGLPPTAQADLYSLGRLLEKLFSAENASRPAAGRESPGDVVTPPADDPLVGPVIARCLAENPAQRPASALEVAHALGWDPLAEACAAGRLLSPTEVADAPVGEPLSQRLAWPALAIAVLGMVVMMLGHMKTSVFSSVQPWRPDQLQDEARKTLIRLGYDDSPVDRAWNYRLHPAYRRGPMPQPPIGFWYRESAHNLASTLFTREAGWRNWGTAGVTFEDPPLGRGESFVVLDATNGHLREFRARPVTAGPPAAANWFEPFFASAELDLANFGPPQRGAGQERVDAPVPCDEWLSWTSLDGAGPPLVVVAGLHGERPVYFQVRESRDASSGASFAEPSKNVGSHILGGDVLLVCFLLAAVWLVPRNLRLGYADRAGAARIAAVMFVLRFGVWLISAHHVSSPAELNLFVMGVARALFDAVLIWLFYVALEPFVRRLWPVSLVSWNRLLAGRWRDPLVGSSVLAGLALGVLAELVDQADIAAALQFFPREVRLTPFWPYVPQADVPTLATLGLSLSATAVTLAMFCLLLLVLFRLVLRSQWLAAAAFAVCSALQYHDYQGVPQLSWACHLAISLIMVFALTRFGLLAGVSFWLVQLFATLPLTLAHDAWYCPFSLFAFVMVAALAVYGLRVSQYGNSAERVAAL